jgi:hypothetical protein
MGYRAIADVTMIVHFAVLAYIVCGGFLAWRWPRAIWPHFVAAGWGVLIVFAVVDCPLTIVEDWARRHVGEQGLPRGFIDTYLTGVVYPARDVGLIRLICACLVAVSWIGAAILVRHRATRSTI